MKTWLFGTYLWQGNPKALFMYMSKHYKDTHELWWIAENEEDAKRIRKLGYNSTYGKSDKAEKLFSIANVYVTENFREYYPKNINKNCKIFNLWHGVGLKHVEFGVGMYSGVTKNIIKKYTANYSLLKNNTKFLVTSEFMEDHFTKDMKLSSDNIIRGIYPRNIVYKDDNIKSFNLDDVYDFSFDSFSNVALYAPTWRNTKVGMFKKLIPDIKELDKSLKVNNTLLIIKVHPQTKHDYSYIESIENKNSLENIIFWNDNYDIYEVFNKIDIGIVDYSSILYDMIDAGVEKFIRYTPDYENYIRESELIGDYETYTDGINCYSFEELIQSLKLEIPNITKKEFLTKQFFEYSNNTNIDYMIEEVDSSEISTNEFKDLHTYDIFDTLIRRNTLMPESVFFQVQRDMKYRSNLDFPKYLVERYPKIRHDVEIDLRDIYKKTLYERNTDKIEVTLEEIFVRLQENYELTDEQVKFLYDSEVEAEITCVEGINHKINELFKYKEMGSEIYLISDMYLPKEVIRRMLVKVDDRFIDTKIYLSSEIGYQKSTGKLYEFIFFDSDYSFNNWIHHGDNKHADGTVPRRYGIKTFNHDMDSFIGFEKYLINHAPTDYKVDSYKLATAIQRYRRKLLTDIETTYDEELYYSFTYIGTAFVPYIHWSILDAIKNGYKTLYFISRDGYFLKQIADVLIEELNLNIKTKYIYGSRKAWRVASFINEVDPASFTSFGMFTNMNSFDDLVQSSQLDENELLQIIPELKGYKDIGSLKGDVAVSIRKIFENSESYKTRLLEIAKQKREIVVNYLKQEINFDEKFAFVEFWGRGYTQDTLTRLLEVSTDKPFINPFYYIRNFTPNYGKSVRHRFTSMPSNFSYFESIFAQTPYKSIPGYVYNENKVIPIIQSTENNFHQKIEKGIKEFSKVYSQYAPDFENDYYRYLAETSYRYQFDNPDDKFISNVFSRFKDNLAMYGEPVEFAPKFTFDLIKKVGLENLKYETRDMRMSFARSNEDVQNYINAQLKANFKQQTNEFITNPLQNYIFKNQPFYVVTIKDQEIFQSVNWSKNSILDKPLFGNTIVKIEYVEWAKTGVPRLKTKDGYITANKHLVDFFSNYYYIKLNKPTNIFKNPNLSSVIIEDSKEDTLSILGFEENNDGQFILTKLGYILFDNENMKLLKNKNHQEKSSKKSKNQKTNSIHDKTNNTSQSVELPKNINKIDQLKNRYILIKSKTKLFDKIPDENIQNGETDSGNTDKIVKIDDILKSIKTNAYYFKVNNKFISVNDTDYKLIRKDISRYYSDLESPVIVIKKDTQVYDSCEFSEKNKTKFILKRFNVIHPKNIEWTIDGTPTIKFRNGYITANKNNILFIDNKNLLPRLKLFLIRKINSKNK